MRRGPMLVVSVLVAVSLVPPGPATAHHDPTADPWLLADCTTIGGGATSHDSPYSVDVTVRHGDTVRVAHATLTPGPEWVARDLTPGRTYTVTVSPRPGYTGEVREQQMTTSTGCQPAPTVTVLETTRTRVWFELPGEDPTAFDIYAAGAHGEDYARPVEASSPYNSTAGKWNTRVEFPPGSAPTFAVGMRDAKGEGALAYSELSPPTGRTVKRLGGSSRYATGARLFAEWDRDDHATWVVVASGTSFPDALAAANYGGTPVVLTDPHALSEEAADSIRSLAPYNVQIVGGDRAVSSQVADQIEAIVGQAPRRFGGADRYGTAALIAKDVMDYRTTQPPLWLLASGEQFPDALAAGGLAANGAMLALTARDALPQPTADLLVDSGVSEVIVVGGPAAISDEVLEDLSRIGIRATRTFGPSRTETAAAVARLGFQHHLFDTGRDAIVARGDRFPDALAASSLAASLNAPILLTPDPHSPGSAIAPVLAERGCLIERVLIAGGTAAVTDEVARHFIGACDPEPVEQVFAERLAERVTALMGWLVSVDPYKEATALEVAVAEGAPARQSIYTTVDTFRGAGAMSGWTMLGITAIGYLDADGDGHDDDASMLYFHDLDRDGTCDGPEWMVEVDLRTIASSTEPC